MKNMEISGQDASQHGHTQEVKIDEHFYEQTETDACKTPDIMPRNTRIAQVLHKDRTRVLLEPASENPPDIEILIAAWASLPKHIKDVIMALVTANTHVIEAH